MCDTSGSRSLRTSWSATAWTSPRSSGTCRTSRRSSPRPTRNPEDAERERRARRRTPVKRLLPFTLSILAFAVVACGSETPASSGEDQGVRGVVLLGPRCPVETVASPCPDEPLADVTIRVLSDGEPLDVTATSDRSGRFELRLSPGEYTLEA